MVSRWIEDFFDVLGYMKKPVNVKISEYEYEPKLELASIKPKRVYNKKVPNSEPKVQLKSIKTTDIIVEKKPKLKKDGTPRKSRKVNVGGDVGGRAE